MVIVNHSLDQEWKLIWNKKQKVIFVVNSYDNKKRLKCNECIQIVIVLFYSFSSSQNVVFLWGTLLINSLLSKHCCSTVFCNDEICNKMITR